MNAPTTDFAFDELWTLLEEATLGLWKWDLAEDRVTFSPSLCRTFGVDPEDLSYGDIQACIHEADRARHDRIVADYISGEGLYSIDARFRFPDGYRWAAARGVAQRDESGRATQMLGWLLDATELEAEQDAEARDVERRSKEVTERQRTDRSQQLESLGLLASGVAHDFNNLLMVILGNAELSLAEPESAADAARKIVDVAKRASQICGALLAHAGHEEVAMRSVALDAIATGSRDLLRMSLVGGPRLTTSVAPCPPTVRADPTQLQRVLVNLVLNAKEAGAANVEVTFDSVDALPKPQSYGCLFRSSLPREVPLLARITVADDGPGIPEEERERIFEPFHSSKESGTGLGLSATLGIVDEHQGAIRLSSRPGNTRFEIYLPVETRERHVQPPKSTPSARLSQVRVLVVDDEPLVTRVATRLLQRRGVTVESADSGLAAMERLTQDPMPFDAVLLDLSMPGMSGTEVLRRLRAELPDLPVIVCSGFGTEAITDGLRADREAFLQKPYTGAELDRALASVLNR